VLRTHLGRDVLDRIAMPGQQFTGPLVDGFADVPGTGSGTADPYPVVQSRTAEVLGDHQRGRR
jgi:hypothetical protein